MDSAPHQDRLETVSALAASLADRILMERLTRGRLPLANANRLWTASLLLEEHARPVPGIVADVLAQFRHVELADVELADGGVEPEPSDADETAPRREQSSGGRAGRKGVLVRLLRPFRPMAEA